MSGVTQYGFEWGPMLVERMAHIPGRGYVVRVKGAGDKEIQVLVSEKGMAVTAFALNGAKVKA